MTTQLKQEITARAQEYISQHNLMNTQFAQKVGLRAEYLTHMFKHGTDFTIPTGGKKPTPIADKYFERIAEFIGYPLNKTYWTDKPTDQLVAMISILTDAKKHGETRIITGETGSGKSHTLGIYLRKHPADTYMVTVGSSDNLGDLIDKVCQRLKITTGKTRSKKLSDIVRKLRQARRKTDTALRSYLTRPSI